MPRTAEESNARLSDTNITDFSNIIEYIISKKLSGPRADKNSGQCHFMLYSYSSLRLYGSLCFITQFRVFTDKIIDDSDILTF